jgi:predicted nuclease with RNAse H fold
MKFKFIGIDLSGSEKSNTGICISTNKVLDVFCVKEDKEILEAIPEDVKIVAIDAPLSLPLGRKSIYEKNNIHFRKCDLELMKMKIKFFPITFGSMRMLTERGMRLKQKIIEKFNVEVIEVFPGATYDVFGIPRKSKAEIIKFFVNQKFLDPKSIRNFSQDELDAIACSFTAFLHLKKKTIKLGDEKEGTIIIPKTNKSKNK